MAIVVEHLVPRASKADADRFDASIAAANGRWGGHPQDSWCTSRASQVTASRSPAPGAMAAVGGRRQGDERDRWLGTDRVEGPREVLLEEEGHESCEVPDVYELGGPVQTFGDRDGASACGVSHPVDRGSKGSCGPTTYPGRTTLRRQPARQR